MLQNCVIVFGEIKRFEQALPGWMTNKRLAIELKVARESIKNITILYRQAHPEWFYNYKNSIGQIHEHYSPKLCDLIRDEINKFEQSPAKWMTNGGLAIDIKVAPQTIKRIADSYRQSHPEWFHEYKRTSGNICEYYSPELCDIIRNEIDKFEPPPPPRVDDE